MQHGRPWRFRPMLAVTSLALLCGCVNEYELWLGGQRNADAGCGADRCEPIADAAPRDGQTFDAAVSDAAAEPDAGASDAAISTCSSDDDCTALSRGFCDEASARCAQCLSNSDCQEALGTPHCNLDTLRCEGCVTDDECSDDTRCEQRTCVAR